VPLYLDGERYEACARPLGITRRGERQRLGCRCIDARVSNKAHQNRFPLRRASAVVLVIHDPPVREPGDHTKS
jgi:hypothetical protein